MIGQVTKILSNAYRVSADGQDFKAIARGKIRIFGDIFVGDEVEFELTRGIAAIEKVLPRKTVLVRPYVSNVDTVLIVVAPVPEVDWYLVDKMIVNAAFAQITPILAYNKSDLGAGFDEIARVYGEILKTISVSAETGDGIAELVVALRGKTVAFAGQSAVGKTSILNAFAAFCKVERKKEEVGEISEKSQRGKNTTRHVEMFDFGCFKVVDTCGFNMLECALDDERNLAEVYEDYTQLADGCRFRGCAHLSEPDCAVKAAVESGVLNRARYERYKLLYVELKKKRGEKYD